MSNHDLHLTMHRGVLTRALAIGKVTASADKTMPILNAVNISKTDAGQLVAQSTDRYLASRTILDTTEPGTYTEGLEALGGLNLSLATVGFIQKWLGLVDKAAPVTLAFTLADGLTVSAPGAPSVTGLVPIEGKFPAIGKLLRPDEVVDPAIQDRAGAVVLSPVNVGKLGTIAHHCGRHDPVLLRPGQKGSPNDLIFRISNGDKVIVDGVIMGLRWPVDDGLMTSGL